MGKYFLIPLLLFAQLINTGPRRKVFSGRGPVTIRGSGIQAANASSYTVSWPSGTVSGDLAVIAIGQGCPAVTPSGWTAYQLVNIANWNGSFLSKVLNSTDISTGSVAVGMSCGFDGVVEITTFVGPTGGIRETSANQNTGGVSTLSTSTSGAPIATDFMLYSCSNRSSVANTSNHGTLLRTATTGASATGTVYTETLSGSGAVTLTCTFTPSTAANWAGIVVIEQ